MNCPQCQTRIVQRGRDGTLKVRTRLIAIRSGGAEVVCRSCGADVAIDLHPGETLTEQSHQSGPRLVIRRATT